MPLMRYFVFVGGALLALLFIVDACLPKLPPTERTDVAAPVFDTTLPAIAPAPAVIAEVQAQWSTGVADLPAKVRVREAFAQLPSSSVQLPPADPGKSEPKRKRKSVAKTFVGPPTIVVAQQPRFGIFGGNIW